MRTEKEILTKILEIKKSKSDIYNIQFNVLVRKLKWKTALSNKFVNKKYDDEEHENAWNSRIKDDDKSLIKELENSLDEAMQNYFAYDIIKVRLCIQKILVSVWLIGESQDYFLIHLFNELNRFHKDEGHIFLKMISNEFKFNWKVYELRYNK